MGKGGWGVGEALLTIVKIKFILIQPRGKLITGLLFLNLQVDSISLQPDLTL